ASIVSLIHCPARVAVNRRVDVADSAARDAHADRAGGDVARQTDHANVVREVFPAELRAKAEVLRFLKQSLLEVDVAERLAVRIAFGWQAIVVARRGELDGFQRGFR